MPHVTSPLELRTPEDLRHSKFTGHRIAASELRPNQIVNVIRNGVPLRCRVLRACPKCANVIFTHVLRSHPAAAWDARGVLAISRPAQPIDDSGRMPHGTGQLEFNGLTCIATRRGDGLELAGRPIDLELVADPSRN